MTSLPLSVQWQPVGPDPESGAQLQPAPTRWVPGCSHHKVNGHRARHQPAPAPTRSEVGERKADSGPERESEPELWNRYRRRRDDRAQAQLVERHIGLVHHVAARLKGQAPTLDFSDLLSVGTLGLLQAMNDFDPARGSRFSTFAYLRIRGAMFDEVRRRSPRSRVQVNRLRQLRIAVAHIEARTGERAQARDVASELGIDLAAYWRLRDSARFGEVTALTLVGTEAPVPCGAVAPAPPSEDRPTVLDRLADSDAFRRARLAVEELPGVERTVVVMSVLEGRKLKEIGAVLGVAESRVCQIRKGALAKLRAALREA